jgi:hypothetical protein
MNDYQRISGIVKLTNSVFRNSPKIEYKGIRIPISDNPTDSEIAEWCKEINSVIKKELDQNEIALFREKLLRDCSNKLENFI